MLNTLTAPFPGIAAQMISHFLCSLSDYYCSSNIIVYAVRFNKLYGYNIVLTFRKNDFTPYSLHFKGVICVIYVQKILILIYVCCKKILLKF